MAWVELSAGTYWIHTSNVNGLTVNIYFYDVGQSVLASNYGVTDIQFQCLSQTAPNKYSQCLWVWPDLNAGPAIAKFLRGSMANSSFTYDMSTNSITPSTSVSFIPRAYCVEQVSLRKCDGSLQNTEYDSSVNLTRSQFDTIYSYGTVSRSIKGAYTGQWYNVNLNLSTPRPYVLSTISQLENPQVNTYPLYQWNVRLVSTLPDNTTKVWGESSVQLSSSRTIGGSTQLNFSGLGKVIVNVPTTTLPQNFCNVYTIQVNWQPPIKPLKVGVALRHVKERSLYGEATKSVRYGPISLRGKIKAEKRLKIKSVDVKAKINREKKKQLTQSMIQKITRDISNSKPIQSSTILWGDFSIPVPEIEVFPIDWLTTASDLSETTRSRIDRRRYQNVVISEVRSLVRTIPTFDGEPMKFGSFAGVEFPLDTPEYIEIVDYFVYLFKPWSGTDTVFYDPFLPSDRWIGDIIDVTQFVKTVHRLPYRGETNVQSIKTNIPNFDTQSFNAPDDFTVGVVFIVKPKMGHAIYNRLYYLDDEVVKNVNLELSVVNDWYWLIRSKPTGMGLAFYPVYSIDEYADAFERLANEHEFYQYIFAGVPEYSVKFEKVIRQKRLPVMLWFLSNYFTIGQNIEGWLRTPSSRIVLLPNQKAQIKIGSETYYGGDSLIAGALIFNWYKELFMNNKVKTEFMPIVRITQAERIDMPNSLVKVGHTYGYGQLVTSDNNFSMNYYFMSFVDYITFRIYRELKNRFSGNPYDVTVKSIIGRGLSEDDIRSLIEQIMNEIVLQVETEWNIEIKEIDVDKTGVTLNLSINEQNFALNL